MSVTANKLDEIFADIQKRFASHADIVVTPLKGNPPDQYEIIYKLKGLTKNNQGDITETTDHNVELTIPFGFPHFPPSCKPKSDIFHPDFDPAAICLGDFWNQDCQISDLILHFAKMINGELYSTTNTFNEEAAVWYTTNADRLPLSAPTQEAQQPDPSPASDQLDIDTLDDSDLTSDFDYLTLDDALGDEEMSLDFPVPDAEEVFEQLEPNLGIESPDDRGLPQLVSKRQFYKVLQTIEDSGANYGENTGIAQKATEAIAAAKNLYVKATELEQLGTPHKALKAYNAILTIVADYPNISTDIKRVEKAASLIQELPPEFDSLSIEETPPPDPSPVETPPIQSNPSQPSTPRKSTKRNQPTTAPPPNPVNSGVKRPKAGRNKLPAYILLSALILTAATSGFFYYSFSISLSNAGLLFLQCQSSLEKDDFVTAEKLCKSALSDAQKVQIIKKDQVDALQMKILTVLVSEKLTQGLAGNVLFEGRYVSQKEITVRQELKRSRNEASALIGLEKWQEANDLYRRVLPLAEENSYISDSVTEEITQNLRLTHFKITFQEAQSYRQNQDWGQAISGFEKAQRLLDELQDGEKLSFAEQVNSSLIKCRFEAQKAQGDLYFSQSNWQKATAFYNQALSVIQGTDLLPEKSTSSISQSNQKAELYATIANGNKAFGSGKWHEAIQSYTHGSQILQANSSLFNQADATVTRKKLDKIIQQTTIIRDRQDIKTLIAEGNYTAAIEKYNHILSDINNSSFSKENAFVETKDEITAELAALEEKQFYEKREQYLNDNYQSLFSSVYTTSVPRNLSTPTITLHKEAGEKVIFKLQCVESARGRPLTLVLHYAYDRRSKQWSFYSEGN